MSTNWPALRVEYVNGSMQYKELAEKHNIKEGTVRQRAKRESWAEMRNAVSQAVTQAVTQKVSSEKIDVLEKWNQETIKEAKMLRMAARALYMTENSEGRMKIKPNLEPAYLNAAQAANLAADRLVRLATGSSTENNSVTGNNYIFSVHRAGSESKKISV